jgi:hypothetical protein
VDQKVLSGRSNSKLLGNPGLVDLYVQFLSAVHEKYTASNLAILAHGLLDHYPGIENGPGRYLPEDSLVIQVESALEIVDALAICYSQSPILVVAHSVGSWITVQVRLSLTIAPHYFSTSRR